MGKPDQASKRKTNQDSGDDEKDDGKIFGFTPEQFEHFKWGLINKKGEKVSDYEKKLGHYEAYLARQRVRKVA